MTYYLECWQILAVAAERRSRTSPCW